MNRRSVPLLRAAAEGLDNILQLQRFHAENYIMILGQLEALLHKCCLLHHESSSHRVQNGSANVRSEVRRLHQLQYLIPSVWVFVWQSIISLCCCLCVRHSACHK